MERFEVVLEVVEGSFEGSRVGRNESDFRCWEERSLRIFWESFGKKGKKFGKGREVGG